MSRQTEQARARAADPYFRARKDAHDQAELMYRAGALSAPDGSVLEVEVQYHEMQAWALWLFGRCLELEDKLKEAGK